MNLDDPILLLYIAGEMPPAEQAAFEEQLNREPALRAAAERLRGLDAEVQAHFTDAQAPDHDVAVTAGVRRMSRAMARAQAEAAAKVAQPATIGPRRPLLPRWAYPLTAAAVIIVGLISLVQWGSNISTPGQKSVADSSDDRDDGSPNGGDGRQGGQGGGGHMFGPRFRAGVFAVDEGDFDSLSISAGSYDVSSMFKTDVE